MTLWKVEGLSLLTGHAEKNEKGVSEMGYGIAEWMDGQLEELRGIKI